MDRQTRGTAVSMVTGIPFAWVHKRKWHQEGGIARFVRILINRAPLNVTYVKHREVLQLGRPGMLTDDVIQAKVLC